MNSTELIRKRNIILIFFLIVVAVFATAMGLVFHYIEDYNTMTLVNMIIAVAFALILLSFRRTLYSYNNLVRIAKVVQKQSKPIPFTKNIVKNQSALKKDFTLFTATDAYRIYYHHYRDKSINIRKTYHVKVVIVIHDASLDFYDKGLHDDIIKLQGIFGKKEVPNKYAILAFKTYDAIDDEKLKAIGEVVSYRVQRQMFTQINIGLCTDEKLAYFLYSKHYYPNRNYMEAVDLIFELTGNPKLERKTKKQR